MTRAELVKRLREEAPFVLSKYGRLMTAAAAALEADAGVREALVKIHDREWPDLDYRKAARHAREMWEISDAALSAAPQGG